jgi:hypothetical protein
VFHGITKDTNLINKLTTPDELSGLLNLSLIALRRLKKDGGFRDISVEKVRKEYEYNANTVKAIVIKQDLFIIVLMSEFQMSISSFNPPRNIMAKLGGDHD